MSSANPDAVSYFVLVEKSDNNSTYSAVYNDTSKPHTSNAILLYTGTGRYRLRLDAIRFDGVPLTIQLEHYVFPPVGE